MLSLAQLLLMPNIMGVDMVATEEDMVALEGDMVVDMGVYMERGLLMPNLLLLPSPLLSPLLTHTTGMEDIGMEDMDLDILLMDTVFLMEESDTSERGLLMPSLPLLLSPLLSLLLMLTHTTGMEDMDLDMDVHMDLDMLLMDMLQFMQDTT